MKATLILLFAGLSLGIAFPVDEKNPFGYPDAAADAALAHGEADPARLDELLTFPAALAIPRLDQYLRKRSHPRHTVKARELIPQVPGWLEYYQWILAEAYKKANPGGNLNRYPGGPPVADGWAEACRSRGKMAEIFAALSMLDQPEAISLIATYLNDRGEMLSDEDMGYPSVQTLATEELDDYFKRTTGKLINMIPDERRAWWAANKGQYPPLPEKPPKPWFPPPATPAPATPRPITKLEQSLEEIRISGMKRGAEARRKLDEEARKAATPPPGTPVPTPAPIIPHLRTEEEARPWRWLVAGVCALLAGGAAYFVFRERR